MSALAVSDDERHGEVATKPATKRAAPRTAFTPETGRAAQARSAASRSKTKEPPTDDAIERGLRERAVTSAKDAEVLLRWLSRPRLESAGLGLDQESDEALDALYQGLLNLARMSPDQLAQALG